jgi:hypothetical protein
MSLSITDERRITPHLYSAIGHASASTSPIKILRVDRRAPRPGAEEARHHRPLPLAMLDSGPVVSISRGCSTLRLFHRYSAQRH